MTANLLQLSKHDLETLASALRSGRLAPPYSTAALKRILYDGIAAKVVEDFADLADNGFSANQIAILLDTLRQGRSVGNHIDLVTTGPDAPGTANRDTGVVVRQMFGNAQESVLVAGFAVYQGRRVFETLAKRMDDVPNLDVEMYLDVQQEMQGEKEETLLVKQFANRFKRQQWPDCRRYPRVYYDPRALSKDRSERAWLHAKCIVVDSEKVFISSANFTEHGQRKNIEVGVLISSPEVALQLSKHFKSLAAAGMLKLAFE